MSQAGSTKMKHDEKVEAIPFEVTFPDIISYHLTLYLIMPILGSFNSATNKDMMAKIWTKWGYNYLIEMKTVLKILWKKEKMVVNSPPPPPRFLHYQRQKSLFMLHPIDCLQMLPNFSGPKFCCLAKS